MTASPRVAAVVLGMHRSGTTALTRTLALLGAHLPADLVAGEEVSVRGANWEARSVTRFNERVLEAAGTAWDEPVEIAAEWLGSAEARSLLEEGVGVVGDQFGDSSPCLVKDPRICRLVPLWTAILERAGLESRFVLPVRNPLEVADSLAARNDFPPEKSLLMWLRYVLDSERDTRGHPRVFVTYDRLLDDWRGVIATLRSALELPLPPPSPQVAAEVDGILSPALRHHRREIDAAPTGSPLDRWTAAAFGEVAAAADEGRDPGGPKLDAIRDELAQLERTVRPLLDRHHFEAEREVKRHRRRVAAVEKRSERTFRDLRRARDAGHRARRRARREAKRARALEAELAKLRGSRSWRLTAPLRGLGRGRGSRRARGAAPEPPAPFVIGVGRSGTTLLRLMLDAHPDLAIPPETRFVPRLIRAARKPGTRAEDLTELLASERNWADFGLDGSDVLEHMGRGRVDPGTAVRAFYKAYAARFGKSRWGDKTPPYGGRMRLISRAVPEARFVHVVRDARDVAASWKRFRESRGDDPLTAAHWAHVWTATMIEARVNAREVPHYLEVRYEELVEAPERVLRSVCELIDLPYDERMLTYHRSAPERMAELAPGLPAAGDQPARSAEERLAPHELTSQPPRPDRIGAWREQLRPEEVAEVEEIAGELLDEAGPEATREAPGGP